ncbi:stage IV sporulation protein B [Anaerocolumna jejuensis DSM 15929]|uniref:Stage IV sporulation protein B n=1 Tax=Anaerocolumna jejuensis DSM 15929 TaxID=1121322 RepID=A0A1M6MK40_9FIRM|nr:SpoIVB peptidase [Anaerocolumna jejuensis]SHJ83865.1 stage IV sporulation protein B [Anaerocolumna jejuensis DSM 15929]
MHKKLVYRRILILALCINILVLLFFTYRYIDSSVPDSIKIMVGENEKFDFNLPMEGSVTSGDVDVLSVNNKTVPKGLIKLNLGEPFTLKSSSTGNYKIHLKLFGFLNFKEVTIGVIDQKELIPCGDPIGIYIETDGIMVLGTGVINGADGLNYEPSLNKLKTGDYITKINDTVIHNKEELIEEIQHCDGKDIKVTLRRDDKITVYKISPVKTADGEYKIGAWIRDNTQGIGTLTFITKDGQFGALGHGITDIDTSLLMEIERGYLYNADIMTIIKGKQGVPGELIGLIKQNDDDKIGDIKKNTNQGIFGRVGSGFVRANEQEAIPVGLKQEIKLGPATILTCVENQVKEYSINIDKIDLNSQSPNKGMVISITDPALIDKTGGIVQGMSGSPIIQNGKIIGAVTHVFIQDSTKGYGTFIENMLNNLEDK